MVDGPKILLVDDDEMIRDLVELRLGGAGYRVVTAADGESGLVAARTDPKPDAIVLDWMMPGLGGPEVCRRLKDDPVTGTIPILLLTSRADEQDIRAGFDHGADDYLTKPFDIGELADALRRLLAGRP